jgi:hypothetical protein
VQGIPGEWAPARAVLVDGLPAMAWFERGDASDPSTFVGNALLSAWTATVAPAAVPDLLTALTTINSDDSPIVQEPAVVRIDRPDLFVQSTDAAIPSPFGPLASRVFHGIHRSGDLATLARLTVTVLRRDAYLLEDVELGGTNETPQVVVPSEHRDRNTRRLLPTPGVQ